MGRRSLHTAEELRELIIGASTELIEEAGFAGLSAREIARRINYSPGTLYNSFENLDELVLIIEGRLLDRLLERLSTVPEVSDLRERVQNLAACYLQFSSENPKLWNLLFEHHMPAERMVPDWYLAKLEALMAKVEDVLVPLAGGMDAQALRRSARVIWAGVHGISSLSAAEKLAIISTDDAGVLVHDFVKTYLAGLEHRGAKTH
jgi:AcrR family transcriptional regulator